MLPRPVRLGGVVACLLAALSPLLAAATDLGETCRLVHAQVELIRPLAEDLALAEDYQAAGALSQELWRWIADRADEFSAVSGDWEVDGARGEDCLEAMLGLSRWRQSQPQVEGVADERVWNSVVGFAEGVLRAMPRESTEERNTHERLQGELAEVILEALARTRPGGSLDKAEDIAGRLIDKAVMSEGVDNDEVWQSVRTGLGSLLEDPWLVGVPEDGDAAEVRRLVERRRRVLEDLGDSLRPPAVTLAELATLVSNVLTESDRLTGLEEGASAAEAFSLMAMVEATLAFNGSIGLREKDTKQSWWDTLESHRQLRLVVSDVDEWSETMTPNDDAPDDYFAELGVETIERQAGAIPAHALRVHLVDEQGALYALPAAEDLALPPAWDDAYPVLPGLSLLIEVGEGEDTLRLLTEVSDEAEIVVELPSVWPRGWVAVLPADGVLTSGSDIGGFDPEPWTPRHLALQLRMLYLRRENRQDEVRAFLEGMIDATVSRSDLSEDWVSAVSGFPDSGPARLAVDEAERLLELASREVEQQLPPRRVLDWLDGRFLKALGWDDRNMVSADGLPADHAEDARWAVRAYFAASH